MDNKGVIDGLRKGEKECIKPRAGDADLWINILGRTRKWVKEGENVEERAEVAKRYRRAPSQ